MIYGTPFCVWALPQTCPVRGRARTQHGVAGMTDPAGRMVDVSRPGLGRAAARTYGWRPGAYVHITTGRTAPETRNNTHQHVNGSIRPGHG